MYVIEVIPLRRGIQIESLTYYSSVSYSKGTIIAIPLRNTEIQGVVVGYSEVSATKAALRAATFSLKKLPPQTNTDQLSPAFLKTAEELAEHYATGTGSVIYALLAPPIRNGDIPLPHTHHSTHTEAHAPELLQGTTDERYLSYRSLVRETFAHSGSLLFVVPTSTEAAETQARLSTGIEERVIILTSTQTKKQQRDAYEKLEDFTKPKLIITTPSHSLIERHDITTVIVESERSQHYRERTRPYLDYRTAIEVHARHTGRRLLFGDLLPRTEAEARRREEVYLTHGETPKRIALPGTLDVVLMKDKPDAKTPFKLFSDKVIAEIIRTRKERERTFLFTARRGISPVVACIDCGHIFRSPTTGAPFSLIRTRKDGEEKRWFVCPASGHRERAADICPHCTSWRLRERGIGIQQVHDEFLKAVPDASVILFDHTTASTHKKACVLRDRFYSTKGAILLGTQMTIPYLQKPIETSVVVNMDALRATPTWRLQEDNFSFLLKLREQTLGTVFVQTRTESDDLLEWTKGGFVERFYDDELELRKVFNYPPHTVFIHLTWQGSEDVVKETENTIKQILKDHSLSCYAAPPTPKGLHIRYGLIRIAQKDWPLKILVEKLRHVPGHVRVVINPDRIV